MFCDLLTDTWIDRAPTDHWAVTLDRDAEYIAVRGDTAVMTRGCLSPEIATCEDADDVCQLVRQWLADHPDEASSDRARVEASQRNSDDIHMDRLAEAAAIEHRVARHYELVRAGLVTPRDVSEVASGVTAHEVAIARWQLERARRQLERERHEECI